MMWSARTSWCGGHRPLRTADRNVITEPRTTRPTPDGSDYLHEGSDLIRTVMTVPLLAGYGEIRHT